MDVMHSLPACRAMVALMQAGDAESAAILTPYNGQVRLIRRILKEHTGELYAKVCQFLPRSVTHDFNESTPFAAKGVS